MKKEKKNISFYFAFKTIIWPRKKLILLGLFLIIIGRLSALVIPAASKYLIDDVIVKNDIQTLKVLLVVVFVMIVIQAISSLLLTRLLSIEAESLIAEIRAKVQKKVLSLPVSFFDNRQAGNIVSRIMYDAEGVKNLLGTGFVQLLGGVITIIISLILLFKINVIMTLAVLLPLLLFTLMGFKALSFIRPVYRQKGEINAKVTGRLTESINGIRIIKGFGLEHKENFVFNSLVTSLFKTVKKSLIYTALLTSTGTFILGLTTITIMGIGAINIINGDLTFGEFLSFTIYLGYVFAPIMQMSDVGSQITESLAGLDRIEEIMELEEEATNDRDIIINKINGDVRFKNVYFSYESEKNVLRNLSFHIKPGTITALVGSSGSGKSTIASLLAAFITPKSGKIEIDGIDLSKITIDSYRKQIGVVLQDDFLFEGTIKENILFSNSEYSEEDLQKAVKISYVNEFTDRFDKGLDTIVGERGVKLSGGQRQRISIARAILSNPKIIILDEATSNLDTESELLIQKGLGELIKGKTSFIIAHRLSTIKKADQILVIEEGRIVERGNHQELLKRNGRYKELYTYQAKI